MARQSRWISPTVVLLAAAAPSGIAAADTITYAKEGTRRTIQADVLGRTARGEWVARTPDGQDHYIPSADVVDWKDKGSPAAPYSREQLKSLLRAEFGGGFYFVDTNHFLVVSNCDSKLARQAGTLLERAYHAFRGHFAGKGAFPMETLRQPLVAVVFRTRREYLEETSNRIGRVPEWSAGVYSPRTNRFYLFDAFEGSLDGGPVRNRSALASPGGASGRMSTRNVESLIHEATHQLAFNLGIHQRHGENPAWFVEGLATYFETADDSSQEGWKRGGELNAGRLAEFARIFPRLKPGFLDELVANDSGFRERDVGEAYALSWALTYYLMKVKQTGCARYIRAVQARGLSACTPAERLADFKTAFGATPKGLERDFSRYMAGVLLSELKKAPAPSTAAAR